MKINIPVTATLREIERMFAAAGHQLWLVGGCVRDALIGIEPKDIDLATDATPDEQIAIYEANGVRFEPTGLKHGTITVIRNDEIYEITTFRTDVETDGRHAVVAYTRDLIIDLERRDLTINAMAMSFKGEIIDPFGGQVDLQHGLVRFVGDPVQRIREDYLRILRWFRFMGRFINNFDPVLDKASCQAVKSEAEGLKHISVERIWSEMSKILTGPSAVSVLRLMHQFDVSNAIGLPYGYETKLIIARENHMDAATTLGGYLADFLNENSVEYVIKSWKLSNAEKHRARFVSSRILDGAYTIQAAKLDLVNGEDRRLVTDTLRLARNPSSVAEIEAWRIPTFPIQARELVAAGMIQGPAIGERMKKMREQWISSNYRLTASALLERVPA